MTDRELLELAAKAAGVEGRRYVENEAIQGEYRTGLFCDLFENVWNPLTDDGDALRLAVTLNEYEPYKSRGGFRLSPGLKIKEQRLAIVRAAAEIGKAIKWAKIK